VTGLVFPFRALAAALGFAVVGLLGFLFVPQPWAAKAPNAVFYAVLVLNTFYSVRFFDALPPQDRDERIIDGALSLLYVALAATIGASLLFAAVGALLFVAAVAKYVLLLRVMDRHDILRRKILIDGLGLALCLATLIGGALFDPLWSAWAQAVVFAAANVYLLAVRPMYSDPTLTLTPLPETQEARRAAAPPRR
jgi:hypothetical protein